jgi:hypothetical protein
MIPPDVVRVPPNTKLPPNLIVQFWADVYGHLRTSHGLSDADAAAAVVQFRAETDHLVEDMRYHRDADHVAETIATGWRNRVARPAPTAPPSVHAAPTPPTVTP